VCDDGKFTSEDLERVFTYHPPDETDLIAYKRIREAGRALAEIIFLYVPDSEDRVMAIRKVREAVMTANSGIATRKRFE